MKVLCKWNGMPWKLVTNLIGSTVEDELEELWVGVKVDDFSTSDSVWFQDHRLAFLYLPRESHHHIKCPRVLLNVLGRSHWERCWISRCIYLLEMQEPIGRGPAVFVIHGPGRTIYWHVWQAQPCCRLLLLFIGLHLAVRIMSFPLCGAAVCFLGQVNCETLFPMPTTLQEPRNIQRLATKIGDSYLILPFWW